MRCCVDLIKFILFILNFLCFLGFCLLIGGSIYVFLHGEETFIGKNIEPNFDQEADPQNATYFLFIIISLVVFTFFALFTCLGCCGTAFKSICMLGSFIVILFVLFGASVGALIFLHTQSGAGAVDHVLNTGLYWNIGTYDQSQNVLTYRFWNWLQPAFQCCGVDGYDDWKDVEGVKTGSDCQTAKENCVVPQSCCLDETECMYEPKFGTVYTEGCLPEILLYVKILFYGVPSLMLISLIFAFIVSASVSSAERRRKAARHEEQGFNSQYSVGAEEDFHHTSYHDNPPFNPQYETEMPFYGGGNVMNYPTGTVPPPNSHIPLLHQAPPSYNEAVLRRK